MSYIAVVGGGPRDLLPDLKRYDNDVTFWIGSDRGALTLIEQGITPDIAIGDFDSVSESEKKIIKAASKIYQDHEVEKDETDLELAILKAMELNSKKLLLFGVTGGRLDHGMAAVQLLYRLLQHAVEGIIIDAGNWLQLFNPGKYELEMDTYYSNISFLPFSPEVSQLTLAGFYYPLKDATIKWGSTLCISNKLHRKKGTFSFDSGILIVIKSRDVLI